MRIPEVLFEIIHLVGSAIAIRWDFLAEPYGVEVIVHDDSMVAFKVDKDGRGFTDDKFEKDIASELEELFPKVRDVIAQSELLNRRKCHITLKAELTIGALSLEATAATGSAAMSIRVAGGIPFLRPFHIELDTTMTLALDINQADRAHIINTIGKQAVAYCVEHSKLAMDAPSGDEVLAWENDCRGRYDHPTKNWKYVRWVAPTFLEMVSKTELDKDDV
jgi:hypothetical protein